MGALEALTTHSTREERRRHERHYTQISLEGRNNVIERIGATEPLKEFRALVMNERVQCFQSLKGVRNIQSAKAVTALQALKALKALQTLRAAKVLNAVKAIKTLKVSKA